MNSLESDIQYAEKKYLSILSDYCKDLFTYTHIPSHDHTHHLRVWRYCKEIIRALSSQFSINYTFIESCLIAALFHDTGLTKTLNENHGNESKKICKSFFENFKIARPKNIEETLNAIELHDNKDYKENKHLPNSIFAVLCNADDLDAFGNMGVVRYTEIYLLRGTNLNELPLRVIENLDNRFNNFEKTYSSFDNLYSNHKNKYLITRSFFENLMNENF